MKLFSFFHRLKDFHGNEKKYSFTEIIFSIEVIVGMLVFSGGVALYTIYLLLGQFQTLQHSKQRVERLKLKAQKTQLIRTRAATFADQLKLARPEYIVKALESKQFLEQEKDQLQQLDHIPLIKESVALQARLETINNSSASLKLIDQVQKNTLQETVYGLNHPLEINPQDLKSLLEEIEESKLGKPQSILQSMTLIRKNLGEGREVFECDFKFLQRTLKDKT